MIKAVAINHFFNQEQILYDISIEIPQGSFTVISGESGSGKSTLLSIVSTLMQPTSGYVQLLDTKVEDIADIDMFRRKNIGFVFQFHYLIKYLTVEENVMLAALDSKKEYQKELFDKLAIGDIAQKYPYEISGGERQRVAIARALINNPKIVFADEPTGNLDSKNSLKVFELLQEISLGGTTVIAVTHDTNMNKFANLHFRMIDGHLQAIS